MCIDANERKKIMASTDSNVLVDASAGTGKTTIMVEKALQFISRPEFRHYQKVAMITFTRFATQQIRDKIAEIDTLGSKKYQLEVSTNNGFVFAEIIRPFLREAYGKEYPSEEFKQDFSKDCKFPRWEIGMEQLQEKNILGSYMDSKKDFTFQLALNVLKKSRNARRYIKTKYPAMFLDEYQDFGQEMHDFFMYLKNELNISLFIVGDIKQAIYGFRGADPELFNSLYQNGFTYYQLLHNFRSSSTIINYASYFLGERISEEDINGGVSIKVHDDWKGYICREAQTKFSDATIAYLINSPLNYKDEIKRLQEYSGFVYMEDPPLGTEYPNFDVLYPLLSLYHDEDYNGFDLLNDLGLPNIKKTLSSIEEAKLNLENMQVEEALNQYSNIVERQLSEEEGEKFTKSLEVKWKVQFHKNKPLKQIMTIHKSKGLEFDFVYIDANSFYHFGKLQEQNHYVAITRAKKGLSINLNHRQYKESIKSISPRNSVD